MDTATFSDPDYWDYHHGYISFTTAEAEFTQNLETLGMGIETDAGYIWGETPVPVPFDSIVYSSGDTLQIGDPLRMEWFGSDCDFVDMQGTYRWRDSVNVWHYQTLDSFVADGFVEYPAGAFTHDGEIRYYYIVPVSGPCPNSGARGNMSGAGTGFLYYTNTAVRYQGYIIVGQGLYGNDSAPEQQDVFQGRSAVERARELLSR